MRVLKDQMEDAKLLYNFLSESKCYNNNADFILLLGSHDLRVTEHASKIYFDSLAPLIICSGGYGKVTNGIWNNHE